MQAISRLIGAGTGQDSLFFEEAGLEVLATDLSPEMVARCCAKGLEARRADFLNLGVAPESFDAVFALNCMLHVPNADFPKVLTEIREALVPGGLFFLGVYGGDPFEGVAPDDWHAPPRFFSHRSDDQMEWFVTEVLEVIDFHVVNSGKLRFQSFTLRRPMVERKFPTD